MGPPPDLFLSYHRADRPAVGVIRQLLSARGISVFLDVENLLAGRPWPQALEEALSSVKAVAVCLGREIGGWQRREIGFALDRQVQEEKAGRSFPVIPVLLPEADLAPSFLFLNTWVDLRADPASLEGIDAIERALTRPRPESAAAAAVSICPYRGLRPFREEHAAFFVGREAVVERLLDHILSRNLVALVGSSGSGKSSVAQAGLVPRLRRQRPPAPTWDCAVFTPGNQPFHHLASALLPMIEPRLDDNITRLEKAQELGAKLADGKIRLTSVVNLAIEESKGTDRLLLIVDQFEELFTLTPEDRRARFVEELLTAADASPVTLLLTLRADFYGHVIALSRKLSDRLERGQVNLGPMLRDELERAIVRPARLVGLDLEPGLTRSLLDDAGTEPGNLPLLEFALTELWQPSRRMRNLLTHRGYEEIGLLAGAIARRAEEEFGRLTTEQQEIAPRLLTRLVRVALPDEGGQDTRRLADTTDLSPPENEVIRSLADAKLLVTGRDIATGRATAQVAHEALIRSWKRLSDWVKEDRQFLLWRQRLEARVTEWQALESDEGALLPKALTPEALMWMERRAGDLSAVEVGFIRASEQAQRREQERWQSLGQVHVAQRLAGESQRLLREEPKELELATLLAVEAMRRAPSVETSEALGAALELLPRPMLHLRGDAPMSEARFSVDGSMIATACGEQVLLWESASGKPLMVLHAGAPVGSLELSADGRYLATGVGPSDAVVWEIGCGAQVMRVTHTGEEAPPLTPSEAQEISQTSGPSRSVLVRFSPDGRMLATAHREVTSVLLWRIPAGDLIHTMHGPGARDLAFDPSGRILGIVWRGGLGHLVELDKLGKNLARAELAGVGALAFSPDAQGFATAVGDQVIVHGLRGEEEELRLRVLAHEEKVRSLRFSANGRSLAMLTISGLASVWPRDGGGIITVKQVEPARHSMAISGDGQRLAVAGPRGVARVVEVGSARELARMTHWGNPINSVGFGPNANTLITSDSIAARVWRTESGPEIARVGHKTEWPVLVALAFSHDGKLLATYTWTVQISDPANGSAVARVGTDQDESRLLGLFHISPASSYRRVAFSPGGTQLAFIEGDQVVLAEAATGQVVRRLMHPLKGGEQVRTPAGDDLPAPLAKRESLNFVVAFAFSPDGRQLASAAEDGTTRLWDTVVTSEPVCLEYGAGKAAVAFSPDGKLLARAGCDSTLILIESKTGREFARLPSEGTAPRIPFSPGKALTAAEMARFAQLDKVADVVFSPDGNLLAGAVGDQVARLWEPASGRLLKLAHAGQVTAVRFSRDGRVLVTSSADGTVRTWDPMNGSPLRTQQHERPVTSLALSPDGRYAACIGEDIGVHVWDLDRAWELTRYKHVTSGTVEFSPDGRLLAIGGYSGVSLYLWRPEDLIGEACSRLGRDLTADEWRQYLAEPYRSTTNPHKLPWKGERRVPYL